MLYVLRMVEERFHRDTEGRPLREGRTPPELVRPGELEYRTCPLPGIRRHHECPMNVSALRQTSAHWDDVTAALRSLRAAYAHARGAAYGPDLMDLWCVSQLACAVPWSFVLRGEVIPAHAAALAKVALGTGILAHRLLQDQLAGVRPAEVLTAERIAALAEITTTLVGESEVCPAPDRMIAKFSEGFEAGQAAGAAVASPDDHMLAFGASYTAFKYLLWLLSSARRFLHADLIAAHARDASVPPAELVRLVDTPVEPPDCFRIEPSDQAATPLPARAVWFTQLGQLLVPFAPDGSDQPIAAAARAIAAVMGDAPDLDAALLAELAVQHPAAIAHACAAAITTFIRLDQILAACTTHLEASMRRALGGEPTFEPVDAAVRDRLVPSSPRAFYASLAPIGLRTLALR